MVFRDPAVIIGIFGRNEPRGSRRRRFESHCVQALAAVVVSVAALVSGVVSAGATTVVNADPQPRTVSIAETNKAAREETIPASGSLKEVCLEGCRLTLVGEEDATYIIEGKEHVTIEDGRLYWDGPLDGVKTDERTPFRVGPDGRGRAPGQSQ